MQQPQPLPAVHGGGNHPQPLEVIQNSRLNALQPGLGGPDVLRLYAKGQVLGFGQAAAALGKLALQDAGVLPPYIVEIVLLGRNDDVGGGAVVGRGQVQARNLHMHGAVKEVEEVAPALENGGFVIVLAELVVDILELHGFGVIGIRHPADAVREHPLVGDAVLGGQLPSLVPL